MKTILGLCFASFLLGAIAQGQTAPPAATPAQGQQPMAGQSAQPSTQAQSAQPNVPRVAPGSVIPVQLTKTIDSKKAKAGEEIEVKVTQDMKNDNGEILVPKDTKVLGHITEAQKRSKEQKESELGITFERAMMNGSEVPMPMSIQAIIVPPPQNTTSNAAADNSGAMSAPSGGGAPQAAPTRTEAAWVPAHHKKHRPVLRLVVTSPVTRRRNQVQILVSRSLEIRKALSVIRT
jgi:hypothetical protein